MDSDITTAGQLIELLGQVDPDTEVTICVDLGDHAHYTMDATALVTHRDSETVSLAVGERVR